MPEDNPNSIIMVLIFEDPTSWRCMVRKPRDYGFTFFNREDLGDGDDIVLTAIDSVIQHQSALYDPIPIPRR